MTVKELREMIENLDDNATLAFVYHKYDHGYCDYWTKATVHKVMTEEEYKRRKENNDF